MGRSPCCSKEGLNRGAWTAIEDKILTAYINAHGEGKWRGLPKRAGLKRCGKSCRLRWLNYLRPDIKRGNISRDEEELIIRLHKLLGNRWSLIAGRLPGRTDNEIKNYWNTTLGKKVEARSSLKPSTHSPTCMSKSRAKKAATEPPVSPPAAIRTRAQRCTKLIFPSSTDHNKIFINPTFKTPLDLQPHLTPTNPPPVECSTHQELHKPYFHDLDSSKFGLDDDINNDYNCNNDFSLGGSESMFKECTTNGFLEDNGSIDMGFLASLLNNEEWPWEENGCADS